MTVIPQGVIPPKRHWTAALPSLLITLDHLPTSKSNQQSMIHRDTDLQLPGLSDVIISTDYQSSSFRLSLDGEIMTALIMTSLYQPDHASRERLYLDESFRKYLGTLDLGKTSITYLLQRLSRIEHCVQHSRLIYDDSTPPIFTAGTFIEDRRPYFEWSAPMLIALEDLRHTGRYPRINLTQHAALRKPVSRRLYRYFYRNGLDDTDVHTLAEALGIFSGSAGIKDDWATVPSWHHLHRALNRATEELVDLGILEYAGYAKTSRQHYAFFDFNTQFF